MINLSILVLDLDLKSYFYCFFTEQNKTIASAVGQFDSFQDLPMVSGNFTCQAKSTLK